MVQTTDAKGCGDDCKQEQLVWIGYADVVKQTASVAPTSGRGRRYDIDWLRVIAIFLLIPFHTGRIFDDDGFYIKNAVISPVVEEGVHFFFGQWRLALLFVVSGVGTYFALGFRPVGQYLRERTVRLLVPLVAGVLLIVPPQLYYRNLFEGRFEGSYWAFYPTFFWGISPDGNFEWAHLWFLAYLFVYAVLTLPLLLYLRSPDGHARLEPLARLFERPGRLYVWALPLIVGEVVLRARFDGPQTLVGDWANLVFYLLLFVYGYLLVAQEGLIEALRKQRRLSLGLALGTLAALYALRWTGSVPEPGTTLPWSAWVALSVANTWLSICALLGYARAYLTRDNWVLRTLAPLTYPIYIFHQTIIVVLGYYVIAWPVGVGLKFAVICGATLILAPLLALLSNALPGVRVLFGGSRSAKRGARAVLPSVSEPKAEV